MRRFTRGAGGVRRPVGPGPADGRVPRRRRGPGPRHARAARPWSDVHRRARRAPVRWPFAPGARPRPRLRSMWSTLGPGPACLMRSRPPDSLGFSRVGHAARPSQKP